MHKYIAEAIGTFALSLIIALSLGGLIPFMSTPVIAGLTLALFAYTIGPISGCHINPAVTVALLSLRLIRARDAAAYVAAQALGAGAAFFLAAWMIDGGMPMVAEADTFFPVIAEAIGAFFFTFGLAAVASKVVPGNLTGLVAGGSLLLGILVASGMGSLGVLNPAVAFAINSFNALYLFGPILGGLLGMWTYRILVTPTQKEYPIA